MSRNYFKIAKHVLIVPLWNWNSRISSLFSSFHSSNRTFMELKFVFEDFPDFIYFVLIVPLWNWNAILNAHSCRWSLLVLIVPLWNWNTGRAYSRGTGTYRSNRTFMELKFARHPRSSSHIAGSNRTFMELKLQQNGYYHACNHVLIVPLWNWNPI